jgi:sigma-E factor negative regulatory protein RseC
MHTSKPIEHIGVIQQIEGSTAHVVFTVHSACNTCHAKGVCSVAGMEEKSVDVIHDGSVRTGEKVKIVLRQSLGYKALLLGYLLPFLFVLSSLVVFTSFFDNEALAGIYSLAMLIPYYLIIYFFRKKIRRDFSFTIRKLK